MAESENLLIKVDSTNVLYFDKILESTDNIGVVTVLNGKKGLLEIKSSLSLREELLDILNNIGMNYEIVEE